MKDFIAGFFGKPPVTSEEILKTFFENPENQWIYVDKTIRRAVLELLCLLPTKELSFLVLKRNLTMIRCDSYLSCTFSKDESRDVILIFPDLLKLLKSAMYRQGLAILAHELGHLTFQHGRESGSYLERQIQADTLAVTLGFREELQQVLQEVSSRETKARLQKLK